MSYKRLGDYIRQVSVKNTDLNVKKLLGVSIKKKFVDSIANTDGTDMRNYRVVKKNQFAYSPVTSRNGEKITIALLKEYEEAILSPMYTVFEIIDSSKVIPEFIFLWFNRAEFDRYTRFNSWGSARETFSWEDLCEVRLPIPNDIEEQRKYVNIYQGLLNNQQCYEKSLDDLQLICDTYIENLISSEDPKNLGDYIQPVNKRNTENKISKVQGVSIQKKLIETKANMKGVNISDYKIVDKNQFVFNPNTARMGEKICVALNSSEPCVVSKIYPVFEIKNNVDLIPEYLYLWFSRDDFNRYARFHSWGSARETFDWEDMCNVKLPIPDIKVQEAIVTIYNTLETRRRLNEELKAKIKPLCPVLMRGVVENNLKEQVA